MCWPNMNATAVFMYFYAFVAYVQWRLLRFHYFKLSFPMSHVLGILAVCVRILEKNSKGFWVIVQVKWKGTMKNWRFGPIYRFTWKRYSI